MKRLLFLSTLLSLTGITIQTEGIKDVDCKVFSKLITSPEIQLVDCRTPEEFAEGYTLFNLQGGIISWKEEGYPIETNESNTMARKPSHTTLSITNTSSSVKPSATHSPTESS